MAAVSGKPLFGDVQAKRSMLFRMKRAARPPTITAPDHLPVGKTSCKNFGYLQPAFDLLNGGVACHITPSFPRPGQMPGRFVLVIIVQCLYNKV